MRVNKFEMVRFKNSIAAIAIVILLSACSGGKKTETTENTTTAEAKTSVTSKPFGTLKDRKQVTLYTLTNKSGASMSVTNYGGIIVSLNVPDKDGIIEDVVLGFDSLSTYEKNNPFFGALIGRYGNRIAKGKFKLDGTTYTLATNDGPNHLHGGVKGFDKVFWNIDVVSKADNPSLRLTYHSVDGEEGYPGNLEVEVMYTLTEMNELKIDYKATSDKKTIVNLTQHTYFNLTGNAKDNILGHELTLASDRFLPVDATLIPTGELKSVKGTPFDFTVATTIGARINENDGQLKFGKGYDHCWVLTDKADIARKAASLYDPVSGRQMDTYTTEPAIQFYSGNFLTDLVIGKGGKITGFRSALCLETEHFPDSPNQSSFPSVVLNPGETYQTSTIYKFTIR